MLLQFRNISTTFNKEQNFYCKNQGKYEKINLFMNLKDLLR